MRDLIVLGGGPAGYAAAARAGGMGKNVLLIDRDGLGGTCLNRGCIPTKAFLHAAKLYRHALGSEAFGVRAENVSFDYPTMRGRVSRVRDSLRAGVSGLLKKSGVETIAGEGTILDGRRVRAGDNVHETTAILIATGSRPIQPPIPGLSDNPAVVDSAGLLSLESAAESLTVIGGGVIGIEFACFYALLGAKVTVIEMLPQICGGIDRELALALQKRLESRGAEVHVGARVEKAEGDEVFFLDRLGAARSVRAERILTAAGRVANLDGFGLENLNLDRDARSVRVNARAETSLPGVYAAGDVTGRFQLAHFASRQGVVAVNNMFGCPDVCRETAVPAVIYTDPEIAAVGLTEERARAGGLAARTVKMPLGASGRFLAETDGERGLVKAVLGGRDELLGMHVIGPYASEMIGAACVMIENEMRASDIREIVFPHPTVGEIMKEALG